MATVGFRMSRTEYDALIGALKLTQASVNIFTWLEGAVDDEVEYAKAPYPQEAKYFLMWTPQIGSQANFMLPVLNLIF